MLALASKAFIQRMYRTILQSPKPSSHKEEGVCGNNTGKAPWKSTVTCFKQGQVVTENHSHEDSEVKHKQRLTQHEIVSVNAIVSSQIHVGYSSMNRKQ